MSTLETTQIAVTVDSLAKPVRDTLLAARAAIQASPNLQAIFHDVRAQDKPAGALADTLFTALQEVLTDPQDLWETCEYLADEFRQVGEHILIVSRETGKAIAKVSEDDIYVPQPVARETGHMAQPLPRLKPELEGLIVQWQFTRGRDQRILETLTQRSSTTELLRQEGDPRLLRATAAGRKHLVELLEQTLPGLWGEQQQGVVSEFLRLCSIEPLASQSANHTASARIVTPVSDPLAMNVDHDTLGSLKHRILGQWVRGIAQLVAQLVHEAEPVPTNDSLPTSLWIAERFMPGRRVLPVPGAKPTLLNESKTPIVRICIDEGSYVCRSREFLDRWEVGADVKCLVVVDSARATPYDLGVVPEEHVAEIL
jgi:hypothetical protein